MFTHDASKVNLYIICLFSENNVAEQKVLPQKDHLNVWEDLLAPKYFYEGVGLNANSILAAENDIQELFYAVEKKPHMWWDEFDIRLTHSFAISNKDAGRQVHTDKLKLHLLNKKIPAKFLTTMKTTIEMHMSVIPITITYYCAIASYRIKVNQIFPN